MVCTTGSNYCNSSLTFSATTNHITTSGYGYDAAGDLTADGTGYGTHSFQWDAEGRMVSVDGVAGQACQPSTWTACFAYNALGQRVQKTVGTGDTVYYYYDAFGNLAKTTSAWNEYLFPGNFGKYYWNGSNWETDYTHVNPLGSSQVVTRADGTAAEYEIFFAFGGMRWGPVGGTQDVRFASMQERDLETQGWQDPLDPTPNRTYGSGMGRWFSPDPVAGDITNPQSLNRYAYVLNNPTTLTDPLGLGDCPPGTHQIGPGQCESYFTGADQLALVGPGWDEFDLMLYTACGEGGCSTGLDFAGAAIANWLSTRQNSKPPVVTNPSQTGPQQVAIGTMLAKLLAALACDPDCTSFLAQNGLDPIETLTAIIANENYGHADISSGGNSYGTAAVTTGVGAQAGIFINNEGAFFSGTASNGASMTVGPGNLPGGTAAAQAFVLLHELGHATDVLRPDAGVPKAGKQNDKDIQSHCSKTISSFK
jgi:RHS repeat-associated protein